MYNRSIGDMENTKQYKDRPTQKVVKGTKTKTTTNKTKRERAKMSMRERERNTHRNTHTHMYTLQPKEYWSSFLFSTNHPSTPPLQKTKTHTNTHTHIYIYMHTYTHTHTLNTHTIYIYIPFDIIITPKILYQRQLRYLQSFTLLLNPLFHFCSINIL